MFMNWKVPNRITDEPPASRTGSALYDPDKTSFKREIPQAKPTLTQTGAALPDITTRFSGPGSVHSASRHLEDAHQTTTNHASLSPRFVVGNGQPKYSALTPLTPRPMATSVKAPNKSKTYKPTYQTKSYRTQQLFNTFKGAPTFTTLNEFMQTATESEKDLVEKTMRLIYGKENSVGKDSVRNIQKWLDTASVDDRAVALNFFESIGIKMMSTSTPHERDTVIKILDLLKNYQGRDILSVQRSHTFANDPSKAGPKYLRLLTPGTRANKWMHQTWHHLPCYKDDDPVYNKSAIYSESNTIPHRHWNIHPDWELKQQH